MNTPETTLLKADIKRLEYEVRDLTEQRDILRVQLDNATSALAELCNRVASLRKIDAKLGSVHNALTLHMSKLNCDPGIDAAEEELNNVRNELWERL